MDLTMDKAMSISNGGCDAISLCDNIFKTEKRLLCQRKLQPEERELRICKGDSSSDTLVSEEGAEEGAPGARAEIPLQPMMIIIMRQLYPCSP
ncbi:hypothetical protein DUI87_12962 [Hirundo rustica rustica]|uniref:Uncharacterized protein n=1 Tax=Hirundo rustica rustica TaxID=333673 RepID=A0A3M0KAD4_HIRRU|nr:hypothetical protein DUI87_12962 [Hirundo rustica rustica]